MSSCGNGLPDAGEKCDDGNSNSGDGCSRECQVENGYICTSATVVRPSQCVPESRPKPNEYGMRIDQVYVNIKNVFVRIVVDRVFNFANANEMANFMHYEFA